MVGTRLPPSHIELVKIFNILVQNEVVVRFLFVDSVNLQPSMNLKLSKAITKNSSDGYSIVNCAQVTKCYVTCAHHSRGYMSNGMIHVQWSLREFVRALNKF